MADKKSGLVDIAESQMDATSETIVSALNTLETQIDSAREIGSDKAKLIIKGFGGETKMAELIEKLAGYMGEAAGAGMAVGSVPMVVMAGAAKGIYKKITE
jgi:tellurite resistance protein